MPRRIILTGLLTAVALFGLVFFLTRQHGDKHVAPLTEQEVVAQAEERKPGILDLYKKLQPGMTRRQVEDILGPPVFAPLEQPNGKIEAAYLGWEYAERSLLPHESPFLPAGIYVTYQGERLTAVSYNPQWVKQSRRATLLPDRALPGKE